MGFYTFTGKILPERAAVTIAAPISVKAEAREAGMHFEAIIVISVSQILITVKTAEADVDMETLKNYIDTTVRAVIDTLCYLWGRGYDVEITSAIGADDKNYVFGVGIPILEKTKNDRPLTLDQLWPLAYQNEHLRHALADLREAIRSPADTGFFCYRAIESVRQHFVSDDDKAKSWELLHSALCSERSWTDPVKKYADQPRHGKPIYVSDSARADLFQRTWKIIDRFCIYLHRGSKSLSSSEFSILKM